MSERTTSDTVRTGASGARRAALVGAIAAFGSALAANLVAIIGKAAGVQHARELQPGSLTFLTVLGVSAGTTAWVLISRRAADPALMLRRLIPIVLVASLIPDLAVGLGTASWGTAITLGIAHLAVFAVTVPLLSRQLNPASRPT